MKTIKVALLAALLTACGGEKFTPPDEDAAALQGCTPAPQGYCESVLGGECYLGQWVIKDHDCLCHRTQEQCVQACHGYVAGWSPFTCLCSL